MGGKRLLSSRRATAVCRVTDAGGFGNAVFRDGRESQIINVALPEKDEDDVTCDAIVANILADASFTTELNAHGFTHVGCGTAVAPIVVRRTHEQQRSLIQDDGGADG